MTRFITRAPLLAATAILALSACDGPLDFDLRGNTGGFSTAGAAAKATAARPKPDSRGVISYPNYQVAIAERGDTLNEVAARLGISASELSRFNGVAADVPLRAGEVIALPRRVSEPSPATGAVTTGPIRPAAPVDVTALAGSAIESAAPTAPRPAPASGPVVQTGEEPVRHKVERGETAYTIARLYKVPVRNLAEWNGLGSSFSIREGQYLLIPVGKQAAPKPAPAATTAPGAGSPTPTPPSAVTALPRDDTAAAAAPKPAAPKVDVGKQTPKKSSAAMVMPVSGSIIRAYSKGRNEGIDIKSTPGTSVKAAQGGTVAAITKSADGIPIIVLRHPDNLLTVYANVTGVAVKKGDTVRRGQGLAKLRDGANSYVHFEVRDGFDSVDPTPYLP